MNNDLLFFLTGAVVISACLYLAEIKTGERNLSLQIRHGIIKYICPGLLITGVLLIKNASLVYTLFAVSFIVSFVTGYISKRKNQILPNHEFKYFILSSVAVLYLFYSADPPAFYLPAVAVILSELSISLFSGKYGIYKFNLTSDSKTITASAAYFAVSSAILITVGLYNWQIYNIPDTTYLVISSLLIAFMGAVTEAMSSGGRNYLFGIILYALFIRIFWMAGSYELLWNFLTGLFFAFLIAASSYRLKFLTLNGSVATFLLAGFLFGFGGIKWSVPILAFFILSSILSKVRKKVNEEVEKYFDKTGVRDYLQVFANGGLGGLLVVLDLLFHNEIFYLLYISVLAAVCADTWATEIGTLKRTPTYNIINFQRVEQGISGGISLPGISASILGSFVISLSGIYWIGNGITTYILFVILAGTIGSLFDSLLGATVQVQHKCSVCSKVTEREIHCGAKTHYFKGISWIDNDLVNLAAGISGGLVVIFLNAFL